jgi:hypothetical protein
MCYFCSVLAPDCGQPPVPKHAYIENRKVKYASGDRATFKCKKGFNTTGIATTLCYMGRWNVMPFTCTSKLFRLNLLDCFELFFTWLSFLCFLRVNISHNPCNTIPSTYSSRLYFVILELDLYLSTYPTAMCSILKILEKYIFINISLPYVGLAP